MRCKIVVLVKMPKDKEKQEIETERKCYTCGAKLFWEGHPFLKFWKCPKGCKKIFPDEHRFVERKMPEIKCKAKCDFNENNICICKEISVDEIGKCRNAKDKYY
jgi:hypothetical protein